MRLDYASNPSRAGERSTRGDDAKSRRAVRIGARWVGAGYPTYVIADIGINHNGDLTLARASIDAAAAAGCDAVKFQKRTAGLCELGREEYELIDRHCRARGLAWFASCEDRASLEFMQQWNPVCHEAAPNALGDLHLLRTLKATDRPLILGTGLSTMGEIERSVMAAGTEDLLIAHSSATYPCPVARVNLRAIRTLQARYPYCPIGYAGHEAGYAATLAAVALGATFVERHITLDRELPGSEQRASLDPAALSELVRAIREVEAALGDAPAAAFTV